MSDLHTAVTNIKGRHHCRLYDKGVVVDEMACNNKLDISFCCSTMLRWYDKLGGSDAQATASRSRHKNISHVGKIWYKKDLERERGD